MIRADAGSNKIAICQRKGELEVESFLEGRQLLPWKINSKKNREIPAIFSLNFFLFRLQMAMVSFDARGFGFATRILAEYWLFAISAHERQSPVANALFCF